MWLDALTTNVDRTPAQPQPPDLARPAVADRPRRGALPAARRARPGRARRPAVPADRRARAAAARGLDPRGARAAGAGRRSAGASRRASAWCRPSGCAGGGRATRRDVRGLSGPPRCAAARSRRRPSVPEPARSPFSYAILRVVPRVERGERFNAGVVLFCRQRGFLGRQGRARRAPPARAGAGHPARRRASPTWTRSSGWRRGTRTAARSPRCPRRSGSAGWWRRRARSSSPRRSTPDSPTTREATLDALFAELVEPVGAGGDVSGPMRSARDRVSTRGAGGVRARSSRGARARSAAPRSEARCSTAGAGALERGRRRGRRGARRGHGDGGLPAVQRRPRLGAVLRRVGRAERVGDARERPGGGGGRDAAAHAPSGRGRGARCSTSPRCCSPASAADAHAAAQRARAARSVGVRDRATTRTAGRRTGRGDRGTVGAVCLDADGLLAAATSTGGLLGQRPGRVGDSPLIGAGTWADRTWRCRAPAQGEAFVRAGAARLLARWWRRGSALEAAARPQSDAVAECGGDGGLIAVDARGEMCARRSRPTRCRAACWRRGRQAGHVGPLIPLAGHGDDYQLGGQAPACQVEAGEPRVRAVGGDPELDHR